MEKFKEKQEMQRIILEALKQQPLRREQLLKKVYASRLGGTRAKFDAVFAWLKSKSFIEKRSFKHTASFSITNKGGQYLVFLANTPDKEKEKEK